MSNRLAVVLVNWNGWQDTVACLSSLIPHLPEDAVVLVCDNASADRSLDHLEAWAQTHLSSTAYLRCHRTQLELAEENRSVQLILVDAGGNLGFAGGNNVGMAYAIRHGFGFVWLLNNDTVVDPKAASELLQEMQNNPKLGMCGSTILYEDRPDTIQCLGGSSFDFREGTGRAIGAGQQRNHHDTPRQVIPRLHYISGASMMVSRQFIETIGLMDESYFLYYEEIDWATRAQGKFELGWAPDSIVWHKEGASIGSSARHRPSDKSMMYMCRNRLRFTKRRAPQYFWPVWRSMLKETLVYLKRRDWAAVSIYAESLFARDHWARNTSTT